MRRRATWAKITNITDRDVVISLLRSAGHGSVLDRNTDLCLCSRVIIDVHGNVTEVTLGVKEESRIRFQEQRRSGRQPRRGNHGRNNSDDLYWDLPSAVGKLQSLEKLVLCRCRSLPTTLKDIPSLSCLELYVCDGTSMAKLHPYGHVIEPGDEPSTNTVPSNQNKPVLSNITKLTIDGGIWNLDAMAWMKLATSTVYEEADSYCMDQSPRRQYWVSELEFIRFSSLQSIGCDPILKFLSPHSTNGAVGVKTGSSLRRLSWVHSGLTDDGLERLLRNVVLPFHHHLHSLNVSGNKIQSLQFLLDNFSSGGVTSFSPTEQHPAIYHPLRTFNLEHNPILKHRTQNHFEEQAFQILLLHVFPVLSSLTPNWENWDEKIEYLLRINRGGRVFVEGNLIPQPFLTTELRERSPTKLPSDNDPVRLDPNRDPVESPLLSNDGGTYRKCKEYPTSMMIPLSLWPLILYKAYQTSPKGFIPQREDATALYYLIRNGPSLSEIFAASSPR